MIEIQYGTTNHPEINQEMIKFAVRQALALHDSTSADITVQLTDDNELRRMNKKFRGIDRPTDVLSFNQDCVNPETGSLYLGDIVISLESASKQAKDVNRLLNEECTLLALHGTLHLLGYNHANPQDKENMWRIQDKLMLITLNEFKEYS